ncbi:NACHT domain-containing protein [Elusimicrobiota bacterium]
MKTNTEILESGSADAKGLARIIFEQSDIFRIFGGRPRTEKDWGRISERISKMQKSGRGFGIELSRNTKKGQIIIEAHSRSKLLKFAEFLGANKRSLIRCQMGNMIQERLNQNRCKGNELNIFAENQKGELVSRSVNLSCLFPKLPAFNNAFIEPPFLANGQEIKNLSAINEISRCLTSPIAKPVIVIGPSGVGKTTLLYRAFSSLKPISLFGSELYPVFIPSTAIHLNGDKSGITWEALPGAANGVSAQLKDLFDEGRLILFIDALDENPGIVDISSPSAWAFWGMLSRNRCVLSARDHFYQRFIHNTSIERVFNVPPVILELTDWSPAHAKELYRKIASESKVKEQPGSIKAVEHLGNLSPSNLREVMGNIKFTALSVWIYGIFFAYSGSHGRFARNDYDLLSYVVPLMLEWEKGKSSGLDSSLALGLLRKIAWKSHLKGNRWWVVSKDIEDVIAEDYPWLKGKMPSIFSALSQLPVLGFDAKLGTFNLDAHITEFLIGDLFLHTILRGNRDEVVSLFRKGLPPACQVYFHQGISLLEGKNAKQYLDVVRDVFQVASNMVAKGEGFEWEVVMGGSLQSTGYLKSDETSPFLRSALKGKRGITNFVLQSQAIGLAYGGDSSMLRAYIQKLKKTPSLGSISRSFYLFYIRRDKSKKNMQDYDERRISQWDTLCDWLLGTIPSQDFVPLRPLHIYTLADFVSTKGMSPFTDCGEISNKRVMRLGDLIDVAKRDPNVAGDAECGKNISVLEKIVKKQGGCNGNSSNRN